MAMENESSAACNSFLRALNLDKNANDSQLGTQNAYLVILQLAISFELLIKAFLSITDRQVTLNWVKATSIRVQN
jgi:hypothetical protein